MLSTRFVGLSLLLLVHFALEAPGQESPTPTPSPIKRNIRISFLPPPLDGTISLGIYDAKGKLVRVLHREADVNEFTVGTDALSTTWDGKDDSNESAPPGKYTARGFAVSGVGSKVVGFFFNEFVTAADSPRIQHLGALRFQENELRLEADLVGGERAVLVFDPKQATFIRKLPFETLGHCDEKPSPPNVVQAIDCDVGMNNSLWLIDTVQGGSGHEVKQLSTSHEILHRISIAATEPQPQAIAASKVEDRIFLVEETPSSSVNLLRALNLSEAKSEGPNGNVVDWKIDFEKKITEHRNFSIENGKPIPNNPKNKTPSEKFSVKLPPNPLLADARMTVELSIGLDDNGSFLKTNDGLPLRRISTTPKLIRILFASHGANILDVFQDDGAVVEQLQITGVDQMMSFDCGGFELK